MNPKTTMRLAALGALCALCATMLACTTASQLEERRLGLHEKLNNSAYIEDGDMLALIVDTRIARLRAERPMIPFEIGVANRGLDGLTVRLESFELVDEEGRSYPAVRGAEVKEEYGSVDVDRRLLSLLPQMRARFDSYELIPSRLTTSFSNPIEVEQVYLPRFAMMNELVYFPTPESGVKGKQFSMLFSAEELDEQIVLRFRIR